MALCPVTSKAQIIDLRNLFTTVPGSYEFDSCIINVYDSRVPFLVTSVHSGSYLSPTALNLIQLTKNERFFEEDPYTDYYLSLGEVGVAGKYSRFEFDLNRTVDNTVYQGPQQAWGLTPWRNDTDYQLMLKHGKERHTEFYGLMKDLFAVMAGKHPKLIHLNIHSFNHRRDDDPAICISTKVIPDFWKKTASSFVMSLRTEAQNLLPKNSLLSRWESIDDAIKENYPFTGGYLSEWVGLEFEKSVCSIQIEFNKSLFMTPDGELVGENMAILKDLLGRTLNYIV